MTQNHAHSNQYYLDCELTFRNGTKNNPSVIHEKDLKALMASLPESDPVRQEADALRKNEYNRFLSEAEDGSLYYPRLEELEASFAGQEPVELYLAELKRRGIDRFLTPEEEEALIARLAEDPSAAKTLRNFNLLRVISLARQYTGRGMHILDLLTEGNNGLDKAMEIFLSAPGCRFLPLVLYHIRKGFHHGLAHCTDARVPSHGSPLMDTCNTEEHRVMLEEAMQDILERLSEREAQVLRYRLGLTDGYSHTLEETGAHFGITRERIRQIENKGLRRFSRAKRAKKIRDFYYSDTPVPASAKGENPSENSEDGENVGEILV